MSPWIAIVSVALISAVYKAAGPVLLKDRDFPPKVEAVIDALSPALLTGLILVPLLGTGWADGDWTLLPGIGIAAICWRLGVNDLACVVIAIAVTALTRLLAG